MRGKGESSVFKDARGLWTAAIELPAGPNGVRRRKVIRRKLKKDLLVELARVKADVLVRKNIPTREWTTEQWFTYWYHDIAAKNVRYNTLMGYRAVVFKYIIPTIGKVKLDRLDAAHIIQVHDSITEGAKLSTTYAALAHRVMSASFKVAMLQKRISQDPTSLVKAPKKKVLEPDTLTLQEALDVLRTIEDPAQVALWLTTMMTGARRGEIIGLQVDRVTDVIDFSWQLQRLPGKPGQPVVPAGTEFRHLVDGLYLTRPKSEAGKRIFPMIEPMKSKLEEHIAQMSPNPYGLLWVKGDGRPLDPNQHSMNWRKVLKHSGIDKDVRLHDLRHTAVDLLYARGVPVDIIVRLVGHSKISMTRSYQSRIQSDRAYHSLEQFGAGFSLLDGERSDTPAIADR